MTNTPSTPPSKIDLQEQRIDTWLWAARFFKTRSLASAAIEGGKIEINGQPCKKSGKVIRVGDELTIERGEVRWVITVSGLRKQRGSATIAQTLFSESPDNQSKRLAKAEQNRQNRLMNPSRAKPDQHTRILLRALRGKPS